MSAYQHLLAAISLDELGERVLLRAGDLTRQFNARLSVIHIVEYIPLETGEALMAAPPDLATQLQAQAQTRLMEMCERCNLAVDQQRVVSGGVAAEVHRAAAELQIDLIVVGHHPRHGLAALFSHTEEDIVQRARCDVLAVHLA
jgi:universal stress protein A